MNISELTNESMISKLLSLISIVKTKATMTPRKLFKLSSSGAGRQHGFTSFFALRHEQVCRLPLAPGGCMNAWPRYYFTGIRCKKFMFNGCAGPDNTGNDNNFLTKKECIRVCIDKSPCPMNIKEPCYFFSKTDIRGCPCKSNDMMMPENTF
uniref:BPTI/Kunitz inhibitor domain-containing protein n=1 Tax=Romanomermis culicivorax TaxID=13658 RepID=A0A915ILI7_ROMCU